MQIAQELDAAEKAFMAEGGVDSEDFRSFLAEDSGNVSSDGFFSIQVSASSCITAITQCCKSCMPSVQGASVSREACKRIIFSEDYGGALSESPAPLHCRWSKMTMWQWSKSCIVQVLQKALSVFGLSCQNLDSPECSKSQEHPENEIAFICNLRVSTLLHASAAA